MKEVELKMLERAKELLASGEVARVIGWKKGEFFFDPSPASFETVEELDGFVYNYFCGANLSKYLIQIAKKEGKTEKEPVKKAPNKRYNGKWTIWRLITKDENLGADHVEEAYFFELLASNGEKLLSSEEYTTYVGAVNGIATHKANIEKGNFRITLSKKGDFIFKLLNGKNSLLCTGANYSTRMRCESAVASVKRFAETAVLDEAVQEQYVKTPKDDNAPLPTLAEGCVGKWVIETIQDDQGEKIYYFELFANNGEKLLSSEEYTTYIGAVNGIQTHKANIADGNFHVLLTQRGDYIYKLLNPQVLLGLEREFCLLKFQLQRLSHI